MKTKIVGSKQTRNLTLEISHDRENRAKFTASMSSESPVERWDGIEVLDHGPGAVNMERARGGLPLLLNHDPDRLIGRWSNIRIEAGKLRGDLRFGNSALAQERQADVEDGILIDVSVGYSIDAMESEGLNDQGIEVFKVTKWTPIEASLVSVPADISVGIGRSHTENQKMESQNDSNPGCHDLDKRSGINVESNQATNRERTRIGEINAVAAKWNCADLATKAINEGWLEKRFKDFVLNNVVPQTQTLMVPSSDLGLTDRETRRFSIAKLVNSALTNRPQDAGFEREVAEATEKLHSYRAYQGFAIPNEILKRDLTVGTDSAGGYLRPTEHGSYIDLLRAASLVKQLGATVLPGLIGDQALPKGVSGPSFEWVAEGSAATESNSVFGQVPLSPKSLSGWVDVSRKLRLQAIPSIDQLIMAQLAAGIGQGIDQAAISGSGTGAEPTGILNTSGIGSVVGGTNGAAPDWADIVDLEQAVSIDNALMGSLSYLTNAKVCGKLKKTEKASGTAEYVWESGQAVWSSDNSDGRGSLNGYRAAVSNQVPADLTKGTSSGVCSAIIFGNWSDLIIGEWGTLDLLIDPYSASTSGTIRLIAFQDVDIAVKHAESFAAMLDALTV